MHRPVCVPCCTEMKPERNGTPYIEYADFGPYQIWETDKYKCPGCGHETLVGFSGRAICCYEAQFAAVLQSAMEREAVVQNTHGTKN